MKTAGVIALLFLAAFAAPAYARGHGRSLMTLVGGTCPQGNIQDTAVTCPTGVDKCTVDAIQPGGSASMTCPTAVTVSFSADKKTVTFTDANGNTLNNLDCYIKGGNYYCHFSSGPYYTPPSQCGGNPCGFSHAICCVPPCSCADKIQAALDAVQPTFAASYCPGSTLPTATITVCGKQITASPASTSDCSGKVSYTAQCSSGGTTYTTTNPVTYTVTTDSNFVLTPVAGGCPTATSTCLPNGAPVGKPSCSVADGTCKVTVTYPITGSCGEAGSGTVTYN